MEHYINSLSIISIDHKITDSDIRWQIIKFAVSRDTEENEFRKTIFNCIRHNNEGLPETIKDSVFIAYDHEYSLYALNGDYQEENEHIDSSWIVFLQIMMQSGLRNNFMETRRRTFLAKKSMTR